MPLLWTRRNYHLFFIYQGSQIFELNLVYICMHVFRRNEKLPLHKYLKYQSGPFNKQEALPASSPF